MGKYNEKLQENRSRDYLGAGKHEVTIQSAEIMLGDQASPKWAEKSAKFMFANDEGVAYWDCELAPLKLKNGDDNDMAVTIAMGNIENMGKEWGEINDPSDFAREAEEFIMSGAAHGAVVEINIVEKEADGINPKTGKPYINRNVYVNRLIEAGAGADSVGVGSEEPAVF